MHAIFDFFKNLHDSGHLQQMVHAGGIPLIALIVFAAAAVIVLMLLRRRSPSR